MEAFSLLEKHLNAGGGIPYSSDGEDAPYFDLEFTLPLPEDDINEDQDDKKPQDSDHEKEANLNCEVIFDGCTEDTVTATPDELLFDGEFVPMESSRVSLHDSDQNCKFPVSMLKSAAKFGVVLLKLKKSKPEQTEDTQKTEGNHGETGRKFFSFKFKIEEVKMPFSSLFSRENDFTEKKQAEEMRQNGVQDYTKSKQHYLKMMKPLYVRISKGAETGGRVPTPDITAEKGKDGTVKASGNVKTSPMQWMQKGLLSGKIRSAHAAVAEVPASKMACNRRDDSLLQVQDGIQGAILHCKKSFNASIDA